MMDNPQGNAMTKFPIINHINDLLPHIAGNNQFRVAVQPNGTTVVCYMLQDEDTFTSDNEVFAKECRGITFHADGSVAARTLHKFQNIGENQNTQPEQLLWSRVVRIMDKRDGSMITPVLVNGEVVCKTKKTFTSKEAIAATEFLRADPMRLMWVAALLANGYTPTFEWTSPRFPIVLKYEKDELTLLHVRNNVTGNYMSESWMRLMMPMAQPDLFPIVENVIERFYGDGVPKDLASWDKLKEFAETATGTEGVVIQFEDGDMVKLKTQWYIDLHHSVTFTRWRDIARSVVADQSDDLKSAFAMTGRSIEPIVKVENEIRRVVENVRTAVDLHVVNGRLLNRTPKDMALALKEHELFGLIMRVFRGQEPNYMDWYAKNRLDDEWTLEVVGDAE